MFILVGYLRSGAHSGFVTPVLLDEETDRLVVQDIESQEILELSIDSKSVVILPNESRIPDVLNIVGYISSQSQIHFGTVSDLYDILMMEVSSSNVPLSVKLTIAGIIGDVHLASQFRSEYSKSIRYQFGPTSQLSFERSAVRAQVWKDIRQRSEDAGEILNDRQLYNIRVDVDNELNPSVDREIFKHASAFILQDDIDKAKEVCGFGKKNEDRWPEFHDTQQDMDLIDQIQNFNAQEERVGSMLNLFSDEHANPDFIGALLSYPGRSRWESNVLNETRKYIARGGYEVDDVISYIVHYGYKESFYANRSKVLLILSEHLGHIPKASAEIRSILASSNDRSVVASRDLIWDILDKRGR